MGSNQSRQKKKIDESTLECVNDFIYPIDNDRVKVPIKLIKKKKVRWCDAFQNETFHESDLERFKDYIDWKELSKYHPISPEFYIKYKTRLDEHALSRNKRLSIQTIKTIDKTERYYFYELPNSRVFTSHELDELIEYLLKENKKYDISYLLKYQNINIKTIHQLMKIGEYSNLRNDICRYQPLNAEFVKKHENIVSFKQISYNRNICKCLYEAYKHKLLKSEEMDLISKRRCECVKAV